MNNCLVEKVNISLGNVPGLKRVNCVTGILMVNNYPSDAQVTDSLMGLTANFEGQGSVKGTGNTFFVNDAAGHPLSYYSDISNSIGTEVTGHNITVGRSNLENSGIVITNKGNILGLSIRGIKYDTFDLLGMSKCAVLNVGNADASEIDFEAVFESSPLISDFRAINGASEFDISILKKLPNLVTARIHNNASPGMWRREAHNYNVTGDVADLYECLSLTTFDAQNTGVHGDFYELIQRYRGNGKTSGYLQAQQIYSYATFNGVTINQNRTNNRIVWDSTHAYIAVNTTSADLSGKTQIYYVGYTAAEVTEMKQGLWSGLSDANIIDCSDGGE